MNSPYQEGGAQVSGNRHIFLVNVTVSLYVKYYKEGLIASFGKALDAKVSSPSKKGLKK